MEDTATMQKNTENLSENEEKINDEPEHLIETDLIEMVRNKHKENIKTEKLSEIFTIQLILCVILVLIFALINIYNKNITQWFINEFKKLSSGETEQIIKDVVNYAAGLVKK